MSLAPQLSLFSQAKTLDMVRAKKALGQHFLNDQNIAQKIVEQLGDHKNVLEIGPGTGVLTRFLLDKPSINYKQVEIDEESVEYLKDSFASLKHENLLQANFLKLDLSKLFQEPFAIIGNFPYNISSQIFFKVLENKDRIPEVVGMIQKEVAERIAAPHGNKTYGILSVLIQTFYKVEYCFTVHENVFTPPPRVKSAVIKLTRNQRQELQCDGRFLFTVVKLAFNQRRKTLRNSLKSILVDLQLPEDLGGKRPEQLSVSDFESLTSLIEQLREKKNNEVK